MSFTSMINEAIKKAMLARDKDRLEPLRDIKSKLLLESTSGNGEVSEETALKICMKLHKQRIETYDLYIAQNRVDLAEVERSQGAGSQAFFENQGKVEDEPDSACVADSGAAVKKEAEFGVSEDEHR